MGESVPRPVTGQPSAEPFLAATVLERLGAAVAVTIVALIAWLAVVVVIGRAQKRLLAAMEQAEPPQRRRQQRTLTALSLLSNLAKWVILLGAVLWALVAAGLGGKVVPVLAGAGIVGLAVGFGAQALVRDLISGLFLLLEGQYAVGDFLQASGVNGRVVSVGLRVTTLQDARGQLHYLPNGSIGAVTVRDDPWAQFSVDVLLSTSESAEAAATVCQQAVEDVCTQYEGWARLEGTPVIRPGTHHVNIELPISVQTEAEWIALEELPVRVRLALEAAGVKLPEGRPPRVYHRARPRWLKLAEADADK